MTSTQSDPDRKTADAAKTRRSFIKGAAAVSVAAVSAPTVVRAQEAIVWKFQSTWPQKDIFHEYAQDYVNRVNEMSGGKLKLDLLAAGAVAKALEVQDAVLAGTLDGGHGVCAYWYGKNKAYSLFGTPPSFGWDAHSFLAWFYAGGGEALYKELVNDILKLNLVGFLYFPMPTQPLGWFKKEIKSGDDFKGMKYRTVGLSADLFKEMGASVTIMAGGDIVPAMDRGLLDAAEFNNPSSDLLLGFPDVSKFYMMGSHHQQMEAFEIIFNKVKFDALSPELKAILRNAAHAASADQFYTAHDRYSKDLEEIRKRNVQVFHTGEPVLTAQLAAWNRVLAEQNKDPFFKKVIDSQMAWVKRTQPYFDVNNLSTAEKAVAYKHFFG